MSYTRIPCCQLFQLHSKGEDSHSLHQNKYLLGSVQNGKRAEKRGSHMSHFLCVPSLRIAWVVEYGHRHQWIYYEGHLKHVQNVT